MSGQIYQYEQSTPIIASVLFTVVSLVLTQTWVNLLAFSHCMLAGRLVSCSAHPYVCVSTALETVNTDTLTQSTFFPDCCHV
jgi:hypothetical protein